MSDFPALDPEVQATLETLPNKPGVYVFRAKGGETLYIGKARNLRSRVRSYFQPGTSDVRFFIARLSEELAELQTFLSATEKEAALLENQLIKELQPRYNVKLRDDKEYLSLRLDPREAWPRLRVVRRPREDGASYFGPYHSATAARRTLRLVNRHFQLRTCSDSELKSRTRPCLQYQIQRCPAPCVFEVDREDYAAQVREVGLFLNGRHQELLTQLQERMKRAAESFAYERAAMVRDQIRAVESVHEGQRVASARDVDQDVIAFYREADLAEIAVLTIRSGRVTGVQTQEIKKLAIPDDELLSGFLGEWYARAPVPDEILIPIEIEAREGLAITLRERVRTRESRDHALRLHVPQRGEKKQLVQLAQENAKHAFEEKRVAHRDVESRLRELQTRLRLSQRPTRIECLDISHTSGQDPVASITSMREGVLERERYRSFRIKRARGGDDYGAMYEVLARRLARARRTDAKSKGWELPELFVVDGGRGQLRMALEAARDLEMEGAMAIVGLAKEKENVLGEKLTDRVYLPGQKNPIPLRSSPALQLLALLRDEAHRSSNLLRTRRRKKRLLRSDLDAIPGVGPKTRAKLLSKLGSLEKIRKATIGELIQAGASQRQAAQIAEHLQGPVAAGSVAAEPVAAEEQVSEMNFSAIEREAVERAFEEE